MEPILTRTCTLPCHGALIKQVVINYDESAVLREGLMEAKRNLVLMSGTLHPATTAKGVLFLGVWWRPSRVWGLSFLSGQTAVLQQK